MNNPLLLKVSCNQNNTSLYLLNSFKLYPFLNYNPPLPPTPNKKQKKFQDPVCELNIVEQFSPKNSHRELQTGL